MDWSSVLVLLVLATFAYFMFSRGGCCGGQHDGETRVSSGCCHGGNMKGESHFGHRARTAKDPSLETVQDPICGMWLNPTEAVATREDSKGTHYFCSSVCAKEFDKRAS